MANIYLSEFWCGRYRTMDQTTNFLLTLNQLDEGAEEKQSNRRGEKRCGRNDW